jgi:hypothetical protein
VHRTEPRPLFLIDTHTDKVTEPAEPTPPPAEPAAPESATASAEQPGGGLPWPLLAASGLALLVLLIGSLRLLPARRRAPRPVDPFAGFDDDIELDPDAEQEPERPRALVP